MLTARLQGKVRNIEASKARKTTEHGSCLQVSRCLERKNEDVETWNSVASEIYGN